MDGLSTTQIEALLSRKRGPGKKSSTGKQGTAWIRNADGSLDKVDLSVLSSVGKFEGGAGSIRRSRKGATRRLANGRRYYVQNIEQEVVSYVTT